MALHYVQLMYVAVGEFAVNLRWFWSDYRQNS